MEKSTVKLVNKAVFLCNKSLFFVSAAATSAFQLEHKSWLLRSVCPEGYQIREYGKILVMLVYGGYYGRVYEVYIIMSITVCCHTHEHNSLSQHILHRVQNEDMFDGTSNLMRKSEK